MFNWLKKWFVKPQEQSYTLINIIYECELREKELKKKKHKKRKYVKSGKYVKKNKKKGKK